MKKFHFCMREHLRKSRKYKIFCSTIGPFNDIALLYNFAPKVTWYPIGGI